MTFASEYERMRPLEDFPLVATEWAGRKPFRGDIYTLDMLLRAIETGYKEVEEDLHWRMLQARKRNDLQDQKLQPYEPRERKPKPVWPGPTEPVWLHRADLVFQRTSRYWEDLCFCGAPATHSAGGQRTCINHYMIERWDYTSTDPVVRYWNAYEYACFDYYGTGYYESHYYHHSR